MTSEIKIGKHNKFQLKLYGANNKECRFLADLYEKLNNNNAACAQDIGNFHYGIILDLVKDD